MGHLPVSVAMRFGCPFRLRRQLQMPHACYGEIISWDGKKSPNLLQACSFERLVRNFREVVRTDLQAMFPTSQPKGQVRIPTIATSTTSTFFRNVLRTPYQMQPSLTATRRMPITQASTSKFRRKGAHCCLCTSCLELVKILLTYRRQHHLRLPWFGYRCDGRQHRTQE